MGTRISGLCSFCSMTGLSSRNLLIVLGLAFSAPAFADIQFAIADGGNSSSGYRFVRSIPPTNGQPGYLVLRRPGWFRLSRRIAIPEQHFYSVIHWVSLMSTIPMNQVITYPFPSPHLGQLHLEDNTIPYGGRNLMRFDRTLILNVQDGVLSDVRTNNPLHVSTSLSQLPSEIIDFQSSSDARRGARLYFRFHTAPQYFFPVTVISRNGDEMTVAPNWLVEDIENRDITRLPLYRVPLSSLYVIPDNVYLLQDVPGTPERPRGTFSLSHNNDDLYQLVKRELFIFKYRMLVFNPSHFSQFQNLSVYRIIAMMMTRDRSLTLRPCSFVIAGTNIANPN